MKYASQYMGQDSQGDYVKYASQSMGQGSQGDKMRYVSYSMGMPPLEGGAGGLAEGQTGRPPPPVRITERRRRGLPQHPPAPTGGHPRGPAPRRRRGH